MKPNELAEAARQVEKGVMLTPRMGRRMLAYIRQLKTERDALMEQLMEFNRAVEEAAAKAGVPLGDD